MKTYRVELVIYNNTTGEDQLVYEYIDADSVEDAEQRMKEVTYDVTVVGIFE